MKLSALALFALAGAVLAEQRLNGADLEKVTEMDTKLAKFEANLGSSHLAVDEQESARQNIATIHKDLERIKTAPPSKRQDLVKAVHLRVGALQNLKKEMAETAAPKDTNGVSDLEAKITQIETDLRTAESAVFKENPANKLSILANLHTMHSDVSRLKHATTEEQHQLTKALSLRMQALEKQTSLEKAAPAPATKHTVEKDLERLVAHVKTSDLGPKQKEEIESNVNAMKTDLEKIPAASTEHKTRLKKALKLRMDALQKQIHEPHMERQAKLPTHTSSTHEAKVAKVGAKIGADLEKILKDVHANHNMSPKTKQAAEENVQHMKHDLEKLPAADPSHKSNLQKALGLRMKALHQQLADEHHEASEVPSSGPSKIAQHLEKVQSEVKASKMTLGARTAALDNISAMKKDLEKIATADKPTKQRLRKALKLRMTSLKQQLAKKEAAEQEQVAPKPNKVMADLQKIESEVTKRQSMSPSTKTAVKDNLRAMKTDLQKMQGADKVHKQRLHKALGLRMKVLKETLK